MIIFLADIQNLFISAAAQAINSALKPGSLTGAGSARSRSSPQPSPICDNRWPASESMLPSNFPQMTTTCKCGDRFQISISHVHRLE